MYAIRAAYIPREDMHFDRDYYVKNHIPLAQKLIEGRVNYLQMHAEFDVRDLMQGDELQSPCVMNLLVETESVMTCSGYGSANPNWPILILSLISVIKPIQTFTESAASSMSTPVIK